MIQVVLITRTGKAYLANGIAAFTLDKEAYTPYSQLTATVYGNFSIQQFAGIYRVQLLLDGTELHFGTVERFRLVQENGTSYVRFSSHGLTALLLQNQLEPGLHTAMSLDKLMQDFVTFPKEITWESDTDTSNYLFVKEGTSMWDGVANLTYKLCGRYPFVYHANEIRMHLPETYRNFYVGADTLLGMGMTADQSRIYSRFSMADADGTYDAGVLYRKPGIKLLVDFITNPAFMATGNVERLQRLHDDIKGKDWFMALLDIEEYIQTKERVLADYEDQDAWMRKTLINIANAGTFSSDRTISQYNDEIWHLN